MADFRVKVTHDKLIVGVAGQKATVLKVGPQGVKGDTGPVGPVGPAGANYVLPPATANTLGGVIIGSNLSITGNGVLSANIPPGGVESFNGRTGNVTLTANDVTTVANGIYQANGSYLNDVQTNVASSYTNSDLISGMLKGANGTPQFVAGKLLLNTAGMVGMISGNDTCGVEFGVSGNIFSTIRLRTPNNTLLFRNSGFTAETGTANWSWSDNTILTQGRGDARYQATGNYLNDVTTSVNTTYGTDVVNGLKKSGGFTDFVAGKLSLASYGLVGVVTGNETCGIEFRTGNTFSSLRIRQYAHTLVVQNTGFEVETGTANWTWSANSILTQGRADARYQANGNYLAETLLTSIPTSFGNQYLSGLYYTRSSAPGFPFVAGSVLTGSRAIVGVTNANDPCNIEFIPGDTLNEMRFRSYNKSLVLGNDGFYVETGTANWTWSANTILTQGRGDARYQATGNYLTSANLTWGNITGKPTFANVATSGNYTDLANTPNLSLYLTTANAATTYLPSANFTYANIGGTIPTATNTTLGAIKVGSNLTIANGVLSANVPAGSGGGFQNGDILNGGTF